MENIEGLRSYQDESKKLVIVSAHLRHRLHSHQVINIHLVEDSIINKQDEIEIETNIFIKDQCKFNLMVKRHKDSPINGTLKTEGFVSPEFKNKCLKIKMKNLNNYDIILRKDDIVAVLILTPYIFK